MDRSPAQYLVPVRSGQLQPGMYVAELDRSWLHAPFPATGFLITDRAQIEQLRRLCHHVYVDTALSESLPADRGADSQDRPRPGGAPQDAGGRLARARGALSAALDAVAGIVRDARHRAGIDGAAVAASAGSLAEQVSLDAAMLHCCLRTEEHGGYLCRRAVGTAVVATMLARQLGLDRQTLQDVATGALLLDLGKIAVPVPILAKPGALVAGEQAYVRHHVERGLGLLAGAGLPERAVEMIAAHHERSDGSGYPLELRGTAIPVFGRLAAIADVYDAMTLNRRYAAAMSPSAALRQLQGLGGEKFDAALVGELVRALGTYPTGTLVELDDGCVGLVHAGPARDPLQPEVLLTHDAQRRPLAVPVVVATGGAVQVFRALPPGAVRIAPAALDAAPDWPRRASA